MKSNHIRQSLLLIPSFFLSSISTAAWDTLDITSAIDDICNKVINKTENVQLDLFLDIEDCVDSISVELVSNHKEINLQNKEYLSNAIMTAYNNLSNQHKVDLTDEKNS